MQTPPHPARSSALFFDFDGTLADLAPQPDLVHVSPEVTHSLAQLVTALDGAVAIVSGRPVSEIDHHLKPLRLPVAGVHGAERRGLDGDLRRIDTPQLGPAHQLVQALVQRHPRLRLEVKPGALALHFRQAPELGDVCVATMTEAGRRVEGMALLCGKMVVELKPLGASKGLAVRAFLDEQPFRSRQPWFFGDDVTDEAAFEAMLALGGVAVKIGEGQTLAPYRLADPSALRAWLQHTAALLAAPLLAAPLLAAPLLAAPTSSSETPTIEPSSG